MTEQQVYAFTQNIAQFQGADLKELRKLIEEKIQEDYDRKENFLLHEKSDDYIYIVDYIDDSYHYQYIGKEAYEEYLNNAGAYRIRRKTKDLFPVFETLLEKEIATS